MSVVEMVVLLMMKENSLSRGTKSLGGRDETNRYFFETGYCPTVCRG